jgi:hypothetical protein
VTIFGGHAGGWPGEFSSADAMGRSFDWTGRSSKHFPFDWAGP